MTTVVLRRLTTVLPVAAVLALLLAASLGVAAASLQHEL
jgi:hypothetical protein